jgi:hypothetical protein
MAARPDGPDSESCEIYDPMSKMSHILPAALGILSIAGIAIGQNTALSEIPTDGPF